MAEYWVDPQDGNDANAGTEALPWKLIPGQTGANAVVANDIINVKNGTTSSLRLVPPANGLTYRGYGVASNVLRVRLPAADVQKTTLVDVVRQRGTHEGMWILNGVGLGVSTIDVANARTGVTIEDVHVKGETSGSVTAVTLGSSAAGTQSGITMRRFFIEGASNYGILCYKINPVLEWFKIQGTVNDCWSFGATAANSYRATSTDVARYFECVEPNYDVSGVLVGDSGDGFQLINTSGRYEGAVTISEFVIQKSSAIKQAAVICDGLNGITVQRFHIISTPTAQAQIIVNGVQGAITIQDGYWSHGGASNAHIRIRAAEGTPLASLMFTAGSLTLRRLIVDAPSGFTHLFDAADSDVTQAMDGTLTIEHCTVRGPLVTGLSYEAVVSLMGGNTTYGGNFALNLRNNAFDCDGTKVRLPTGTAGNAAYSVQHNGFKRGGAFFIGSTSYTGLSAFEAAHSAARRNQDADMLLGRDLRPQFRSTLKRAGIYVTEKTADDGRFANPPTIGAYEVATASGFVRARQDMARQRALEAMRKAMEDDAEDSEYMDS